MHRSDAFAPRCAPAATGCGARCCPGCPPTCAAGALLDAGCGTGALAVEAARRGARSSRSICRLLSWAWHASGFPRDLGAGKVEFLVGDMFDPALGGFDHVVGMDSLIHYRPEDTVRVVAGLTARTGESFCFTFAPKTAPLAMMHAVGRLFPRGDRAPAIEPVAELALRRVDRLGRRAAWFFDGTYATHRERLLYLSGTGARAHMKRINDTLARGWTLVGPRFLPFADAATKELPLGRLLRLSLFQVSVGMAMVLLNGTLNRVMIVELDVPAWLVALMVSLPLVFAPFRALVGFRSDTHRSSLGWRRVRTSGWVRCFSSAAWRSCLLP